MIRFLRERLRLNERDADDNFSGWISPRRYVPPVNIEKNFKIILS